MTKAVILLSGGLDSTTVLAIAKSQGFNCHAMTFRYGQRHSVEVESAKASAAKLGVTDHCFVDIDMRIFGGSSLTSDRPVTRSLGHEAIPQTYVPARNTIFLSFALALAEVIESYDIFIGVNAVDYSGYPDCRPEFISAYQSMANLATRAGVNGRHVNIHAPLINMKKSEIISAGLGLDVDYSTTHSCYDPSPSPCMNCDSCFIRAAGFAELGIADPALA